MTGGASGIGAETARALATTGAEVTLAVRDTDAGKRVASQIEATTGNTHILVAPVDLADPASVASIVAAWDEQLRRSLVDRRGGDGMPADPAHRRAGSFEFATNHLGHFALAARLHRALAAARGARIVSVGSRAHLRSPVVFDDIHFLNRAYEPWDASRIEDRQRAFRGGGDQRWEGDGITVDACRPGTVRSNLQRYITDEDLEHTRGHIEDDNGRLPGRPQSREPDAVCCCRDLARCCKESTTAPSKTAIKRTKPTRHRSWRRPLRTRP